MSELSTIKQEIFDYVYNMLGGGMVDVELDPAHYEIALKKALTRYRQRSDYAVEESYMFLTLEVDQNEYILPKEIIEVRKVSRRGLGQTSGGSTFEPFNLAYTNAYLLKQSNLGGLATYELFMGYQELVARMFGAFIEFTWNSNTKKLTILQRPRANEEVILFAYNYRPDEQLLTDYLSQQWLKDYTLASCKYMLGEARSKFSVIAGPQGGSTLNGDTLKAEAQAEMEKLEQEVSLAVSGGTGYGFLIG
jgi:hypothetical protein